MQYTLYIDESGDFDANHKKRKPWVVGGLLIASTFEKTEKLMDEANKDLLTEFKFPSINHFHLTEIRKKGKHKKAKEVTEALFAKLDSLHIPYCFITTVNEDKVSANVRERNYRLMLLDLLLQAEQAISEVFTDEIDSLDLVVATRVDENRQRTTTHADVREDILKSLSRGLESDLVAQGKIALLGNKIKLHMENAKYKWGLVNADFICNTTFQKQFKQNQDVLDSLKQKKRLYQFTTYSSVKLRRIKSHQLNQNYASAVFYALILLRSDKNNTDCKALLIDILNTALLQSGTRGGVLNFDSIIEKIWRDKSYSTTHEDKIKLFHNFESYLMDLHDKYAISSLSIYQFKINNILLLCYNHIADTVKATEICTKQTNILPKLISNPENFSYVLDFYLREVEVYVNDLKYVEALQKAKDFYELVQNYASMWDLMAFENTKTGFESSGLHIRALTNLTRLLVLNYSADKELEINNKISQLYELTTHQRHISRLDCIQVLYLTKQGKSNEAFTFADDVMNETQRFDAFRSFYFLYALNNVIRNDFKIEDHIICRIQHIEYKVSELKNYPKSVIFRELSLFYSSQNNKQKAKSLLATSNQCLVQNESEVNKQLKTLNMLQNEYITNKLIDTDKYMKLRDKLLS